MLRVFISHINDEARIASALKNHIESAFSGQCKVFISSDPHDIPAGTKWLEKISQAIEGANVLVVLCSPTSLKRPWINFEMGCGWIKAVPIIPVCHSGEKKGQLPPPISTFQALDLDSATFVTDFFESLAGHLKMEKVPRIDEGKIKRELMAALQAEPVTVVPEVVVAEVGPPPAPREELNDKSRGILKAIADMGDEGFTAEQLAEQFGMKVLRMEYDLGLLSKRQLITYAQEMVEEPEVARLTQKGKEYLVERGLL